VREGKSKITVTENSICVPLYVFRSGKSGLTLSCADSKHSFKVGSTPQQLQKLKNKLEALFVELVESRPSTQV
jgi:hypothetical protein